jgi:hypothetical protein
VANANRSKQVRKPASVVLRIELCDIEPLIWRRIVVPASWPMSTLHHYMQWVMGWQDTHAHEFRIGDQLVAPDWWIKELTLDRDTSNDRDERRVKVTRVVSESAATGERVSTLRPPAVRSPIRVPSPPSPNRTQRWGEPLSGAVETQSGSVAGDQLTRPRVEIVSRSGGRNALYAEKQANRDCDSECSHSDVHRWPVGTTDRRDQTNIAVLPMIRSEPLGISRHGRSAGGDLQCELRSSAPMCTGMVKRRQAAHPTRCTGV